MEKQIELSSGLYRVVDKLSENVFKVTSDSGDVKFLKKKRAVTPQQDVPDACQLVVEENVNE
jgi:hypothetical protein